MKDWQFESLGDGKERKKKEAGIWNFGCIVTLQVCVSSSWNNRPSVVGPCWALQATEGALKEPWEKLIYSKPRAVMLENERPVDFEN